MDREGSEFEARRGRRRGEAQTDEGWTERDAGGVKPMYTRDFLSRHYRGLFLIPFICILLAVIIMGVSKYPNPPDPDAYDDSDDYRRDLNSFNNIIEDIENTADIIFTIGVLTLSFLFFIAPFLDLNFNIALKIAMLAIGVVLVTHFLNDGFKLQVIFG